MEAAQANYDHTGRTKPQSKQRKATAGFTQCRQDRKEGQKASFTQSRKARKEGQNISVFLGQGQCRPFSEFSELKIPKTEFSICH